VKPIEAVPGRHNAGCIQHCEGSGPDSQLYSMFSVFSRYHMIIPIISLFAGLGPIYERLNNNQSLGNGERQYDCGNCEGSRFKLIGYRATIWAHDVSREWVRETGGLGDFYEERAGVGQQRKGGDKKNQVLISGFRMVCGRLDWTR